MSTHTLVVALEPLSATEQAEYDAEDAEGRAVWDRDRTIATVECSGVDDSCRTWWECSVCQDTTKDMDDDAAEAYDEQLLETGEAHGVQHLSLHFGWATASEDCLATSLDGSAEAANEAALAHFGNRPGRYPVEFDSDEYVEFRPSTQPASSREVSGNETSA